ncbi:MAG: MCP four helix bundle domain-containing protein, partial [Ancalomicrobiaceae bacterium]|nr:MCP four helix bundle domain-containing protein [Ancalomicrobiaceae bacterium]
MRISVKSFTFVATGVLLVFLGMQASISLVRMQSLHHAIQRVATDRLPNIQLLGEIDAQTTRLRLRTARYVLVPSVDRKFEIAAQLRQSMTEIERDFATYEQQIRSDDERRLWADYKANWSEYLDYHARTIAAAGSGSQQAAIEFIEGSRQTFTAATAKLRAAIDHNNLLTSEQLAEADRIFGDGMVAIIAFACLVCVIGFSLAAYSVIKVSNPLIALIDAMRAIAGGDLSHEVPAQTSRNEIGDMAAALAIFRDELAEAERLRAEQREMDFANLRLMQEAQDSLNSYAQHLDELVVEKTQYVVEREREIVWRLSRATERRDSETGNHIARMSRISGLIAEALGLPKDRCRAIEISAQMHDIGKVGIPDDILFKAGKFTPEERQVMETHVLLGWDILKGSESELIQTAA